MMVDPGWIYEEELKEKSPDQIRGWIRSLQQKIYHLQKMMANSEEYPKVRMISPSPEVQLEVYGLYLQKAREALLDAEEYL